MKHLDPSDPKVREVSLFQNGRNQAMRIPKDMAFDGTSVLVKRDGDRLIVEAMNSQTRGKKLQALVDAWRDAGPGEDDIFDFDDRDLVPADDVEL